MIIFSMLKISYHRDHNLSNLSQIRRPQTRVKAKDDRPAGSHVLPQPYYAHEVQASIVPESNMCCSGVIAPNHQIHSFQI